MTSQQPILLNITATLIEDIDQLSLEWRELENHSGGHSFFLSWYWIGSWLRSLPASVSPLVLRFCTDSKTVGLAILVHGTTPILKILSLSQISLNTTGDSGLDNITIEYNGFLAASSLEDAVTRAGLEWLLQGGAPNQSIQLSGIDARLTEIAISLASAYGRQVKHANIVPAPYVDLAAIRDGSEDYLSHLSRNSRQLLRRALRYYEIMGPIEYHSATSQDEALVLFDALETAHQIYWRRRGQPGAFANPFFKHFHTELIKAAFSDGHIEMAQVSAGGHPIGYLYNYVWGGTVYAYQSGFHYTNDKQAKPGYVSHYMAIISALTRGQNIYDFMAGDKQHKTSLSTGNKNLTWLQLRSPILSVRLETSIKSLLSMILNR